VSSRLTLYAALLYVVACWGLNTVLVKVALEHIDPLAFTMLRFIAMTPLTFVLARIAGERIHIQTRDLPMLILCGACGFGLYQYFWILGLANTTPFASALLGSTVPLFTLAMVAITGQEHVRSGRWAGAAIAFTGVAIFEGALSGHLRFRIGDTLALASAFVFAAYGLLSARMLDRYGPLTLVAITMAIGALMLVPGGMPALVRADLRHLPSSVWGIFAFATLFPVVLTYPVWSYGISRLGGGTASLFAFLIPLIAGGASMLILHTHIAPYQLAGAAVCLAGMLVANALGRMSLTRLWTTRSFGAER
jgi:drug/metabolite transporter (DMT)-like permease